MATPFLSFTKQKRLFSRVKRRYQLLLAIITAYILAVLLAVPIGMCSSDDMAGKGCWVEKSHAKYFKFDEIQSVWQAFSESETQQTFAVARAEMKPTLKDERERGDKVVGGIGQSFSPFRLKFISYIKASPNPDDYIHLPALLDPDTYKTDKSLSKTQMPATEFKRLGQFQHNFKGVFSLNTCAFENMGFFFLADYDYTDASLITPPDSPHLYISPPLINPTDYEYVTARLPDGKTKIDRFREDQHNRTIYRDDIEAFISSCLHYEAGQGYNLEDLNWGKSVGFKEPKTLTFRADYEDGQKRLLRLHFHTMGEMKITPFIPRSEAILSLGMLMYMAITSIPVLIAAYFLWKSQKFLRRRYAHANDDDFVDWYKARWLKLSHPEDEAINAISASTKAKITVAPADMLQGIFMLAFSSLMAILLIFNGVKWINWILPESIIPKWILSEDEPLFKRELVDELGYAISKAQDVANGSGTFSGNNLEGWKAVMPFTIFFNDDGGFSILVLLLVFGIILLGFIYIGRMFEKLILNPVLKKGIDGIAQGSAVSGAFGDDALGENAAQCAAHPHEFEDPYTGEFPAQVRLAVEKHANQDLVHLPGKFRAALHKNVSSAHDFSLSDLLEGDMGEILLHTSYFNVKEFHDLFAAALTASGDFKPGPKFKNHKMALKWIKGLKA